MSFSLMFAHPRLFYRTILIFCLQKSEVSNSFRPFTIAQINRATQAKTDAERSPTHSSGVNHRTGRVCTETDNELGVHVERRPNPTFKLTVGQESNLEVAAASVRALMMGAAVCRRRSRARDAAALALDRVLDDILRAQSSRRSTAGDLFSVSAANALSIVRSAVAIARCWTVRGCWCCFARRGGLGPSIPSDNPKYLICGDIMIARSTSPAAERRRRQDGMNALRRAW
ncbi:hypothetical protein HYPSUDRAFT_967879 [Hypholoma sublateritium FD-334 SS-4]|uniref:Uncharacterized protein n=1 Tax=Hypholoma sublateritium (strain FD-334 SS-4) TaxID=945553 RepID=A0A0D2M4N0_HYPSF|nr:hypothetical protein HYPSUDRAFT_967879 [Hypholoma sublateritium FD-334 SS-4]